MGRSIIAILAGVVAGLVTISVVQMLGHMIFETPPNLDMNDREALIAYMERVPIGSLLMVLLSYAGGAFLGGLVAARIAFNNRLLHAMIVGGLLLLAGIANFIMLPHPTWFIVASVAAFISMAYVGGLTGRRLGGKGSGVLMG